STEARVMMGENYGNSSVVRSTFGMAGRATGLPVLVPPQAADKSPAANPSCSPIYQIEQASLRGSGGGLSGPGDTHQPTQFDARLREAGAQSRSRDALCGGAFVVAEAFEADKQ